MIDKNADISVIIPCYNVEEYIVICLDSLINQTCPPDEIICVNDGSTDKTGEIIDSYATRFKQIKIISQPNLGVSVARNKGIEIASKAFIMFVDSDDIVNNNLFHEFQTTFKEKPKLDIFYFNYASFNDGVESLLSNSISTKTSQKKYFNSGTDLLSFLLEKDSYSGVIWQYIFKRNLFIKKFSGRTHEDHKVTLTILKNAKLSCYFMSHNAYMHRNRCHSLSKNINYNNNLIFKKVLIDCFDIIEKLPLSTNAKYNYIYRMNITYLELLLISGHNYSFEEKENIKKELGVLKIAIRIHLNNKRKMIQNIFYVFKFSKKYKCSKQTKLELLKYVVSKNKSHNYLDYHSIFSLF